MRALICATLDSTNGRHLPNEYEADLRNRVILCAWQMNTFKASSMYEMRRVLSVDAELSTFILVYEWSVHTLC